MPACWLNQWVESWQCTNSQHRKKLYLSLLMLENLKLKKVNKSFIPEQESRQVFRVFSDSYMCMNIMNVLCMWISWSCFWTYMSLVEYTDTPLNECPGYDTKQSDGEFPVMLGLWGMQSTPSSPSISGVVALDRVLSMGKIEPTEYLC